MKTRIPVLVAGAGPAGLMTAFELRRRGVELEVIDVQRGPAGRSYALALHAATLEVLREAGLDDTELPGLSIERLRIQSSPEESIELELADERGRPRPLRVVPQATLERALLDRLGELGVEIRWSHRLAAITSGPSESVAEVQRIETGASGFTPGVAVSMVAEGLDVAAEIVVGADGHGSAVRRALGIELAPRGPTRTYAAFDLEAAYDEEAVATIALGDPGAAARWPQGDGRWRWLIEVDASRNLTEPRFKSRHDWEPAGTLPRDPGRTLEDLLDRRFPWLRPPTAPRVVWSTVVSFDQAHAETWGTGGSWLVGDAAHLGNPLGLHSMNLGLQEAALLARAIVESRAAGSREPLERYGRQAQEQWLRQSARLEPSAATPDWLRPRIDRFPACLPASGPDLGRCLEALGLSPA